MPYPISDPTLRDTSKAKHTTPYQGDGDLTPEDQQYIQSNVAPDPVSNPTQVAPVAPVVPTPQPQDNSRRASEILQNIFKTSEAPPQSDTAKEERLRRMGRINMLGQGIGVLGDAMTMAMGGNVRRKQPDRVTPMLYQQYSQMMDKNKADQDAFRFRDLQNKREMLKLELGDEYRKEAPRLQNARLEAQTAAAKAKADQDWNKFVATYGQKGAALRQSSIEKEKDRETRLKAANISANAPTQKQKEAATPVTVVTKYGKTYTHTPEEAASLTNQALSDPEVEKNYPELIQKVPIYENKYDENTGKYQSVPSGRTKTIKNPLAGPNALIQAKHELDDERVRRNKAGEFNQPANVAPTSPAAQPSVPTAKKKPSFFQ